MNQIFKTVLSMSLSGTLLISVFLLAGRLLKGKLGRQWQYYVWLIVLLRLFLPFGPEESLMRQVNRAADGALAQMAQGVYVASWNSGGSISQENGQYASKETKEPVTGKEITADSQKAASVSDSRVAGAKGGSFLREGMTLAGKYLWVIWLAAAFAMLIQKITVYRSYIRYVTAGAEPIEDTALLDELAASMQKMGIGRPVELCVNPLVSSPMLVGYFHPCIVLPNVDAVQTDFPYIVLHELMHYKRRDIWYKWLVQLAVCLHWFNPLVHVMSRKIDRACEFACDEAVVRTMGYDHAKDYGKTLLDAMVSTGTCGEPFAAVTMSANKELLKERLGAIMHCKKRTKVTGMITAGLTAAVVIGAVWIGVYPTAAAEPGVKSNKDNISGASAGEELMRNKTADDVAIADTEKEDTVQEKAEETGGEAWTDAETYYRNRSLPQFYIAFGELGEKEQEMWMDRICADRNHAFFSVCVKHLDKDSPLIGAYAQRFYEEDDVAFFSALANEVMSKEMLEGWLDRAIKDEKWTFQLMLYDDLGMEEEKDALEEEWDKKQTEAYRAVGVTRSGKSYYYQGELVNIFLDMHLPNQSFFILDMNPAGTVNIRIIREQDGQVTGVAYMTEAEVKELLGDMYEDEEEDGEAKAGEKAAETGAGVTGIDERDSEGFPREMVVNMPVCRIRAGAGEEFPVVDMVGKGKKVTVLGKKEGSGGILWYLLDQESLSGQPDPEAAECYIRADLLE